MLEGVLVTPVGVDLDGSCGCPAGDLGCALEEVRPHVELEFLREADAVVEEMEVRVSAARPRFDLKQQFGVGVGGTELDLTGLHVAGQRGESKRVLGPSDDSHGSVPWAWEPDAILVADMHLSRGARRLLKARDLQRARDVRVGDDDAHQLRSGDERSLDPDAVVATKHRPSAARVGLNVRLGGVLAGKPLDRPAADAVLAVDLGISSDVAPRGEGQTDHPTGKALPRPQRVSKSSHAGWTAHRHAVPVVPARQTPMARDELASHGYDSRFMRRPPASCSDGRDRDGPGTATRHAARAGARLIGWAIGVPLATFRFLARRIPIERVASPAEWVADGLVHRRVWVECERPQLSATRLLNIIAADPNVVVPTEVLQFHKTAGDPRQLVVGDRYLIRMAGPWDGPVIVAARDDNGVRLESCPGNPQQGHVDFLVQDKGGRLRIEIASRYRPASRAFRALARFLPLVERMEIHTGGHILEMAAQLAGARPPQRIWVQTTRRRPTEQAHHLV
jgi:hypothetical protein